MSQMKKIRTSSHDTLTFAQYGCALLVIILHSGSFLPHSEINFFIKNVLCRIAVPLFMIVTSYFYRLNEQKSAEYPRQYFKRQIKTYLFWSLVYLPSGCFYLWQQGYPWYAYPIGLLAGLFYLGTWYHLWYIPALLFGIWLINKMVKKIGYVWSLILCLALYLLGSIETYSAYLDGTILGQIYDLYTIVFITTRNGLFFASIFVLIGFILADFREHPLLYQNILLKIALSFIFLCIEGWVVFENPGYDKNFMLGLVPLCLFLVSGLLKLGEGYVVSKKWCFLREQGKYLFFFHPVILEMIRYTMTNISGDDFQGMPLFISTVVVTTLCANGLLKVKGIVLKKVTLV